jgi:hypothetical protein
MDEEKPPISWKVVAAAYLGIISCFGFIRLAIVSSSRDPFIWGIALPRSATFQTCCGLAALFLGVGGLFSIGLTADRGTPRQLIISMLALPLVLILLEIVNLDF